MNFTFPPLRTIQINLIKYWHQPPGSRWEHGVIPRHQYAAIWIVDGPESLKTEVDGRVLSLPTGSLLLLRPELNWVLENRQEGVRTAVVAELWFEFRLPAHGWPPPESWPLLVKLPTNSPVIPLFRFALALASCEEPERTAVVKKVVEPLLVMVLAERHDQLQPEPVSLPEPLERIWQIVRQVGHHLGERSPRCSDLARRAGVSLSHLSYLFKRHLGISPSEFMLGLRLEHAASLLAGSPLSIKEIARMTGFYDQFHFSRQFHRLFGCAPKQYRNTPAARQVIPSVLERAKGSIPEQLQLPSYASADLKRRAGGVRGTPARLLHELRRELVANRSPFSFPRGGKRRWLPVSLAPFANRSRQTEHNGMFGLAGRVPHLPAGTFRAHGIPFVLPDERGTGGRSAITLRSGTVTGTPLPLDVALPLNGRAAGIGLLHACAWTSNRQMRLGSYEIQYADHRRVVLPVTSWNGSAAGLPDAETEVGFPVLQDYWPDNPQFDARSSRKVTVMDPEKPLTSIHYLYVFWWENPRPDVPLRRLVLRGQPDSPGLLAVLGVTLLTIPAKKTAG